MRQFGLHVKYIARRQEMHAVSTTPATVLSTSADHTGPFRNLQPKMQQSLNDPKITFKFDCAK